MTSLIYDVRAKTAEPVFLLARAIRGTSPDMVEEAAMVLAETWTREEWQTLDEASRAAFRDMARHDLKGR
ncbi:hypothetical protein [Roseobacter sp.]|uniref:hypothetical protein n=1 Tax=Roseobacter sp. TaxID=1907202 RepID=UPI002965EDDF|nr:hypothetical protein [Roseobacter sp.]MDW3181738.1 hypothetical protein [Roseobacter sp.]